MSSKIPLIKRIEDKIKDNIGNLKTDEKNNQIHILKIL